MREFAIGFIVGFILFLIAQSQYGSSIETWLWFIAIIVLLYVGAMAFYPVIIRHSLGIVGFLIGIICSLFIWTSLPEIQNFFSSIFG